MSFTPRVWSSTLVYDRLSCPPGLFVQGLETLPVELLVMIMSEYCAANDIQSLISASPAALSCFQANRNLVLGPRCRMINMQLGELLPMALFDIRIRHLREKHNHLGTEAVEWLIKHLLKELSESVRKKRPRGLWPATEDGSFVWRDSLPKLAHLERLISETDSIMNSYATKRWEEMQEEPTRYLGRVAVRGFFVHVSPRLEREPLELSPTEYNRLLETLISFDIYCNAFFYNGKVLFEEDWSFRRLICKSRTNPNRNFPTNKRMKNFYTILHHILDRFSDLLGPNYSSKDTKRGWNNMPRTQGLMRFMSRSVREHEAFLEYLCSKGYSFLLHIENLKGQTQGEFVVATFLHFITLSRLNNRGFAYDWPGFAWLESNLYRIAYGWWDKETGFWDEERLDRLTGRVESWASHQRQFRIARQGNSR